MSGTKIKSLAIWGLAGLLALVFVAAGLSKLMGVPQTVLPFEQIGLPALALLVGLLEIAGAVGLFVPKLRFWAALGLCATMVGAIGYHLAMDPEKAAQPAAILLILCGIFAWIYRPAAQSKAT